MILGYHPFFMHESWIFSFSSLVYLGIITLLILFSVQILLKLRETRKKGSDQSNITIDSPGNFSHSIRTPLNSIMGYCQILLSDTEMSSEQKQYLTTISDNSGHLLNQINTLLDDCESDIQTNGISQVKSEKVKKILIVDDVPVNRTFLKIMLERHGFELSEAANGSEALTLIQNETPDLVLMDIMMPVMDGIETLKVIRACDGHLASIPVIAVTANNIKTNRDSLLSAGFNGLLQKPFREDELLKLINT